MVLHQPLQLPVSRLAAVPGHQQLPIPISILLLHYTRCSTGSILCYQFSAEPIDIPRFLSAYYPPCPFPIGVINISSASSGGRCQHPVLCVVGHRTPTGIDRNVSGGIVSQTVNSILGRVVCWIVIAYSYSRRTGDPPVPPAIIREVLRIPIWFNYTGDAI